MNLRDNMVHAWAKNMIGALRILEAAKNAPGLFKPDTVEQARRDFAQAQTEERKWL